jgi:hypothetical protein
MVGVSAWLKRTAEAFEQWQIATYNAIMTAYRLAKEEYDRRVKEAATSDAVPISIRSDVEYRTVEQAELKRASLELLTDQHFDSFGAISMPNKIPTINNSTALAEGPIVRFFEHAFEWNNIVYTFYPYFWGRKEVWPEKLGSGDNDPVFAKFLSAGYARVVVPVRRGYESHISLYLATGVMFPDGEAPQIGDAEYLSIIDEIKENEAAISNSPEQAGVAEGTPWKIVLPTGLVCLDPDGKLPSWEVRPPGKPIPYTPSQVTCDGIPYNAAQWTDELAIIAELRALGYGIPEPPPDRYLSTADGSRMVSAFQRRANQLGASDVLGKPLRVDGIVGPCTLRVLTAMADLRERGDWPGPGTS